MMNTLSCLTDSYRYMEGRLQRIPGLNYKRKILRLKRNQMMEISDIKHYENYCKEDVAAELKKKIKEIRCFIHKLKNNMEQKKREFDNVIRNMFVLPKRDNVIIVEAQMEDAHGESQLNIQQSGNVLLSTARGSSGESQATGMPNTGYVCSDAVGTYATMAERWLNVNRFRWSRDSAFNTTLYQDTLPQAYVKGNATTINVAPFLYHAYWQGDMEIKVQVNSNKFQIGQLQISWFYGANRDASFETRSNPYVLSQTMHGLLDAGACNEVTLYVPYKYHSPMMHTRKNAKGGKNLSMGTLTIKVLAPLMVPDGQPDSADVAIWVRMVNSTFGGTLDREITFAEPQMEGVLAVAAAEKALRLTGILNADNPVVAAAPTYVMPASVHSLSVGTGAVEPLFPLRLDARGQNSGNFCRSQGGDDTIFDIARVFGLTRRITWSAVHPTGTTLTSLVARPMMSFDEYSLAETASRNYVESRMLPPVAVVSSLFAQWRGSLEYRLDFISSQFHTGRIMLAYVPLGQDLSTLTIEKARSCHHAIFDLQETKSCTFCVPFVYHDIWCRSERHMGDSEVHNGSIGRIFVFVVNALRCPDSVTDSVMFNIYMRAGIDFEVSIPIQPTLGLNYVRLVRGTDNDEFSADNETSDGLYVGTWNDFPNKLVLRWGILPGRIANFAGVEKLFATKRKNIYFECTDGSLKCNWNENGKCYMKRVQFFCVLKRADTWVAFAHGSASGASSAWNAEVDGKTPSLEDWPCDNGSNAWAGEKPLILYMRTFRKVVENQMERENDVVVLDATRTLISTGAGLAQYGENFHSVKDLCRRYQYYGNYVMRASDMRNGNGVLFQFPTFPQGLRLNTSPNIDYVQNRCRDGIIPLLMSGYKFYRGALRFKIVIPVIEGLSFWVQHRPEITREPPVITNPSASDNEIDMLAHGYGSHLTIGSVNGVLEFEVPFYQSGMYGEMGKREDIDNDNVYFGNGLVVCGYNNIGNVDLIGKLRGTKISIFYSVADDFQFHTFQGFPPVIDATAIAEDFPELIQVENQGFGDMVTKMVGKSVAKAADESIVGKKLTEISESLTNLFKEMFGGGIPAEKYVEFSVFMGSQIAHLINNYTAKTMAIVIVSVFTFIGVKFAFVTYNIVTVLEKILQYFIGTPNEELSGKPIINVDNNADNLPEENLFVTYISAIFTAICIYFKLDKAEALGGGFMAKLKTLFTVDLSVAIRSGNGLYIFLRNHFIVVKHMLKKILNMMFSRYDVVDLFQDRTSKGFKFLEECQILNEAAKMETASSDALFIERVTACENIGRNILASILRTPEDINSNIHREVEKQLAKISRIATDLRNQGIFPCIRKRPFHIYLAGNPGIGKTVMVDALAKLYCDEVIPTHKIGPNYMCTVDCGSRFWSQCNGKQPILVFDDLWAVTSGNVFDEMLVHYLALHSNIPFTPPMAAVDDKKMLYAPECVISTSNKHFPNLNNVDRAAINRRRNVLIHVEKAPLDPINYPDCAHCQRVALEYVPPGDIADFHHLQFVVVDDVITERAIPDEAPRLTYDEMTEILLEKAVAHREKEDEMYEQRVAYFLEKSIDMQGTSLEERLENEKNGYTSYFEKLIDQEINVTQAGERCVKRLKEMVSKVAERFYSFEHEDADAQMEAGSSRTLREQEIEAARIVGEFFHPSTSRRCAASKIIHDNLDSEGNPNALLVENELLIQNKNRFDKYFQTLNINKKDMAKFMKLNSSAHMLDLAEEYLLFRVETVSKKKKNSASYEDFYLYLRNNVVCGHLADNFINSFFFDGNYKTSGGVRFSEEMRCADWCVLDSEFSSVVMNEWKNSDTLKKIYYARKMTSRIPAILLDPVSYKQVSKFKIILEEVALWAENLKQKIVNSGFIQSIVSYVKSLGTVLLRALREWCLILIPFLGVIATSYYLTKCDAPIGVEDQAQNYDAKIMRVAKPATKHVAVAHQAASQQAHHVEQLLHSNAVWIVVEYIKDGSIQMRRFRCLMLGVRRMLILKHYYDMMRDVYERGYQPHFYFSYVDSNFRKISGAGRIEIRMLDLEITPLMYNRENDCNLMIVELPTTIPAAKDIVKFFASEVEHSYVGRNGWLVQTSDLTVRVDLTAEHSKVYQVSSGASGYAPVNMYSSYIYDYEGKGVCGSILLAPQLEHPIIGIHVAGTPNVMGIAEPLVRETFQIGEKQPKTMATLDLLPQEYSNININTTIFPMGTVGVPYTHMQSGETQIVPSLIAGVFPIATEPTPLKATDDRMEGESPLQRGVSKHGLLSDPFPSKLVLESALDFKNKLYANLEPVYSEIGVVPLEIAIMGDPLIPELTPLQWTSSEGFPLIKERPKNVKSKKWLFDLVEKEDGSFLLNGIHPRLKQILANELESRKNGIIIPTIFTDVCKDETLPIVKARAGKTRVFSTAPVQFVIAFRMYFGHFMAAFRRARIKAEHGIGIDVNSLEWTKLAHYLTEKGPGIVAGDYSHFGYTLNAQFVSAAFDIMIEWYKRNSNSPDLETDQCVRACLKNEILNVHRLASNLVYRAACGIPSGFPATDIVNSMVNCMYVRAAWREITRESFYTMHSNVNIMVYGDDLAMNVSDKYIEKYNTETLQMFFAQYGIKFTDIDKGNNVIPFRTLDNATFLKCNFRKHESRIGLFTAALDKTSVEGAANWIHKRDDLRLATVENAKQCLELGHGHGREYYEWLYEQLRNAIVEKLKINFIYYSYGELDERRYGGDNK